MTLTGHFLDGLDMLKLFRTARFLFGMLAVLSLLLLPSLSPYRTMASPSFLDPTSADKADDDHGGSSSSLGDADKAEDDHGGSSSSLGDADKADDDHGGSSSSLGDADESTTGPIHHHLILIIILRQRWPQIALGSGLRQPEKLQPGHGQAANVHRVP